MGCAFGSSNNPMAFWFFLLLGIIACLSSSVHGQHPSTDGFISIDCGMPGNTHATYTDSNTNITYVSDDQFTDTGVNFQIDSNFLTAPTNMEHVLLTGRSFPNTTRSCYILKPVKQYQKYLLRAMFAYGDYDGKNTAYVDIQFDLYIDVNLWRTVKFTFPSEYDVYEAIDVALGDSVSLCLVNTGSGTPFISALELRPLEVTMYPAADATRFLDRSLRATIQDSSKTADIRYPDDPYDRIWWSFSRSDWTNISTTNTVITPPDDVFHPPPLVMQTAATPTNGTVMVFFLDYYYGALLNEEFIIFYFSELLPNTSRAFDIYHNGKVWHGNYTPPYLVSGTVYTPPYLVSSTVYNIEPLARSPSHEWAFNSSGLSKLPPILNALEVYTPVYVKNVSTDSADVNAINIIKEQYRLKRNWQGDPCAPTEFAWHGLNCSYSPNPPRITTVNLSASGLTGVISSSFANLTEINNLDLSYNNLTGSIPDVLGNLPKLQVLNLTGNNLTGPIPASLLRKSQQGLLVLRIEGYQNPCANGNSCETTTKKKITTPVIVIICVVSVLLLLVAVCILYRMRKLKGSKSISMSSEEENLSNLVMGHQDNPLQLDNRRFTYKELKKITNNFESVLGKGGFGTVYHGRLEDATQVAVKTRSQSSSQGTKEFVAEVQHLIRIHHRNLVSLVGYCMEGDHLALVYEYMPQGTLEDHIRGKTSSVCALSWGKRLQIAIEAAEGLEYLHRGCKPPLIHRDVKTANILLSESLEAKIADFGLSKAFQNDVFSSVSTAVVGTPGYLDPEYYSTFRLSEKSDVYSFGVVILELITAEPPVVLTVEQNTHIVEWVRQRLSRGNIEDVVDSKLRKEYDVNSIWKTAELALKCTAQTSQQRPTMTDVIMKLKESLALESARDRTLSSMSNAEISQNSAIKIEVFATSSPSIR